MIPSVALCRAYILLLFVNDVMFAQIVVIKEGLRIGDVLVRNERMTIIDTCYTCVEERMEGRFYGILPYLVLILGLSCCGELYPVSAIRF